MNYGDKKSDRENLCKDIYNCVVHKNHKIVLIITKICLKIILITKYHPINKSKLFRIIHIFSNFCMHIYSH